MIGLRHIEALTTAPPGLILGGKKETGKMKQNIFIIGTNCSDDSMHSMSVQADFDDTEDKKLIEDKLSADILLRRHMRINSFYYCDTYYECRKMFLDFETSLNESRKENDILPPFANIEVPMGSPLECKNEY